MLGAILLLAWVVVSIYFIVSGQPVNLPPEVQAYLPHFVVVLAAGLLFFRFRKVTGNVDLDQANLYAVGAGIVLMVLLALALVTWGSNPTQARNWFLAGLAWSPVAVLLIIRYRNALKQ